MSVLYFLVFFIHLASQSVLLEDILIGHVTDDGQTLALKQGWSVIFSLAHTNVMYITCIPSKSLLCLK